MDQDRNCNNELFILRVGKKPLEWIKPKLHGKGPCERFNSSMTFYEDLEILIIHGGRNDLMTNNVFNDFYILDVCKFNWIKINVFDKDPKYRSEHSILCLSNKLYIFGGTDGQQYVGSDLYIINLDFFENKRKYTEYSAFPIYSDYKKKKLQTQAIQNINNIKPARENLLYTNLSFEDIPEKDERENIKEDETIQETEGVNNSESDDSPKREDISPILAPLKSPPKVRINAKDLIKILIPPKTSSQTKGKFSFENL
jgi:hypothetical protein